MALKDVSALVKQKLLEKGERFALVGAMVLMLTMVVFGFVLNGLSGSSAASTTDELIKLKDKGQHALQTSKPHPDLVVIPDDLRQAGVLARLSPSDFPCRNDFFIPLSIDDRKWRKPDVLAPDEFQVDLMRALVRSYVWGKKDGKDAVMFLQDKKGEKITSERQPLGRTPPRRPMGGMGMMGGMGGMRPGMPMMPGMGHPGAQPGVPVGQEGFEPGKQELASLMVPIDKLAKGEKVEGRPAENTYPYRIAVVQGSFPYRRQLDLFRRSLRFDSFDQMEKEAVFEFTGFNVQRRFLYPNGKTSDWKELDIKNTVRPLLMFAIEAEDEKLLNYGLVWKKDRLVVPRPMLARDQKYPEPSGLKQLQETLQLLEKSEAPPQPLVQPKSKFDGSFDDFVYSPDEGKNAAQASAAPRPAGARERVVPEKCLLRFLDVTIQPGFTYEYRIQVEMANPLYGKTDVAISKDLTDEKKIVSDWAVVPAKIRVPDESEFYAVEQNPQISRKMLVKHDQTWVQIHRWLDWIPVNPAQPKESLTPVGDWSIAEQLVATRGEYIGRWNEVEVPVWWPKLETFVFAQPPETIRKKRLVQQKGIPVDFNTGALLVDFHGGKQDIPVKRDGKDVKVRDEGLVELLVLTAEGKMLVRNSRDDTDNAERQERLKAWTDWIALVKKGLEKTKGKNEDPLFKK